MSVHAVHAFHRGGYVTDRSLIDRDSPVGTYVYEPIFFYLVRHRSGYAMFDTGLHRQRCRTPFSLPKGSLTSVVARPDDTAPRALGDLGLDVGDIDVLVLSHLHYDHAGGISAFPHATAVVQRTEADAIDPSDRAYCSTEFEHHSNWQYVEGEHDLLGDGTIRLIPTPGHSAGHQSALVALRDRPVLLAGDAAAHPGMLRSRRMPARAHDDSALAKSWALIARTASENDAVILGAHDLAYQTTIRSAASPYV